MADSRQYAQGRRDWRKLRATLLVLAVLASFIAVQTAAALSNHPDHEEGPNDHCCAACHGGHYPVVQSETIVHVAHLIVAGWRQLTDDEQPISREWHGVNSSRAPPA